MSFLHDIWNPWHGCVKCSEGCQNCYMYFLDRMRDQNGAEIYKTKSGFSYPIPQEYLYVPHFRANCETCGSKLICNGCRDCGKCL